MAAVVVVELPLVLLLKVLAGQRKLWDLVPTLAQLKDCISLQHLVWIS